MRTDERLRLVNFLRRRLAEGLNSQTPVSQWADDLRHVLAAIEWAAPAPQEAEPPLQIVYVGFNGQNQVVGVWECEADAQAETRYITAVKVTRATEPGRNDVRRSAAPDYQTLYHELLYEVVHKHPDETRHETAKRIIHQHENQPPSGPQSAAATSQKGA